MVSEIHQSQRQVSIYFLSYAKSRKKKETMKVKWRLPEIWKGKGKRNSVWKVI
jgi:hypothetical protein